VSLIDHLERWLFGAIRLVVLGVGNSLRRDDAIGIEIVNKLEGRVPSSVFLVKSESTPENFIEPIVLFKPTHILIIDAALLTLSPGATKLLKSIEFSKVPISSHDLPLQIFYEYMSISTSAKIAFLLIQPKDTSFGEGLTIELSSVREKLVTSLLKLFECVIK